MRLVALSVSALLMSGCSWLGGMPGPGKAHQYGYGKAAPAQMSYQGGHNPCTIYSPVQPAPTGCHPSQVVLAGQHSYTPNQPTYATGGYGSHADSAYRVGEYGGPAARIRKPKLRGTLSFGTESSVAGTLLAPDTAGLLYDPSLFQESVTVRSPDRINTYDYSSVVEGISSPSLSFTDVHQSPLSIKAGAEYIMNPKFTLFANGGYTHATGANDASATVVASLTRTSTEQFIDPTTGNPIGMPTVNNTFIPNQEVANFVADFSDHRQFDLEVGARHYLKPIYKEQGYRTITPFVGAAVGLAHVNDITYKSQQNQLFLEEAYESGNFDYYDVPTTGGVTTLYESDWLVNGALTAGLEWQLSPKTALAFESGLKAYQERSFVSGDSGDMNVVVPLTLRGSYNF